MKKLIEKSLRFHSIASANRYFKKARCQADQVRLLDKPLSNEKLQILVRKAIRLASFWSFY